MGDMRKLNRRYKRIAKTLLSKEPELKYIAKSTARIGYLSSEMEKHQTAELYTVNVKKYLTNGSGQFPMISLSPYLSLTLSGSH